MKLSRLLSEKRSWMPQDREWSKRWKLYVS